MTILWKAQLEPRVSVSQFSSMCCVDKVSESVHAMWQGVAQHVISVFVVLSIDRRRLHAFTASAVFDSKFPV